MSEKCREAIALIRQLQRLLTTTGPCSDVEWVRRGREKEAFHAAVLAFDTSESPDSVVK